MRPEAQADPRAEWPRRRSPPSHSSAGLSPGFTFATVRETWAGGLPPAGQPFGGQGWKLCCPGAGRQALHISALSSTPLISAAGSPCSGCGRGVILQSDCAPGGCADDDAIACSFTLPSLLLCSPSLCEQGSPFHSRPRRPTCAPFPPPAIPPLPHRRLALPCPPL